MLPATSNDQCEIGAGVQTRSVTRRDLITGASSKCVKLRPSERLVTLVLLSTTTFVGGCAPYQVQFDRSSRVVLTIFGDGNSQVALSPAAVAGFIKILSAPPETPRFAFGS